MGVHSSLHRFTGSNVLLEIETSPLGLLSTHRSNAEYLDESCTKASSREEFHGPCVRQIEVYDWTASYSDWTEIRTSTECDCTVWTADAVPVGARYVDYSSELNSLSSIVRTFVQENQQQLCSELEYKRKMLVLDATDHRLVQAFFDLKPKKGQVSVQSRFVSSLWI